MKAAQKSIPKIPDGMVELMKNLVKSVLKEQPENIYLFAAEYFENLVLQRDGSLDKEYSVFRKYEEELERRRDKEGCSRCRRLVNVDGNVDDDLSKQAEDDMSVSGVAIRAVPRHCNPLKSQKSKAQFETKKSVSIDSAIDNDDKSISAKSHDKKDAIFQQISTESPDTLQKRTERPSPAAILGPTNDVNEQQIVPMEKIPTEKIIKPLIEEIIEPISARNPDTPTNETSISDANTDRTVIENAVSTMATDNLNDDLNPLEIDTDKDNSIDNEPIQTSTKVQLLKETPISELLNSQKCDRIRTPESDSGLSEKSFNLNIQEETAANTYKAEPIKIEGCTEEKCIPFDTSRFSEVEKGKDEKTDDIQMNKSDGEKLKRDPDEGEQTEIDEKVNESVEERKKETERVRSSEEQRPTNDWPSADPQEIIANDISDQINDPNNYIVPEEDRLEKTKLTGVASPEQHEHLQITTGKNLANEPLAESNDLENKKINKEPNSIEKDQTAASTEKTVISIENKADDSVPLDEETDSNSNELKLFEENEELSKTTENDLNYLQTKLCSDNERFIESNEQKPSNAILEIDTSKINETPIKNSENFSENVNVNKSPEGRQTEFIETTDSQPINDKSNEKTENSSDRVEMTESNEKELLIAESTLNEGEESDKTKSNDDIVRLDERSKSEDQVGGLTKWETTTDAIAQKVQEQDGNQFEICKNKLTEDQNTESIQDPNQDSEPTDIVAKNSEEADTISKVTDGLNSEDLVKDNEYINDGKDEAIAKNSANNEMNELSNVDESRTKNEVAPLKSVSEETIILNELKDVEKNIDDIPETNSPKIVDFFVTETVLEAVEKDSKQNGSSKTPKTQRNESSLVAGEQSESGSDPILQKAQSNETALEIGEKSSQQLNSHPTIQKTQSSESGLETYEQTQPKSPPKTPKAENNEKCEKHSNETESNDQILSEETITPVKNEPTDSSETTIIEKNLESATIESNEFSITNENQTDYANITIKSPSNQEPTNENPENNVNEIEKTHSEIQKNNNDDVISEMSSSVKDYLYEKADTEIFSDDSVQDLDLSVQEIEEAAEISKEDLKRSNTAKQLTYSPQQQDPNQNGNQIQPDSLDNSLKQMGEKSVDTKSVDSLEAEKKDDKLDKCDAITPSLDNHSVKADDKEKYKEDNSVTPTSAVESKPDSFSQDLMGDSVSDEGNYDHMNDQMKNELATLNFKPNNTSIQLSNIEEVDTPVTPKAACSDIKFIYELEVKVQDDVKLDELKKESKKNPLIKIETVDHNETELQDSITATPDGEVILQAEHDDQENPNRNNISNKSDTKAQNNVKTVDFLTSLRHISHDAPSSDLSDTDTEKPELVSNESCIDENSRDEHDDVSEVENFDLSSCGEDSLEAMYYMLRKNEILMDEQRKMNECEDEKITFPEKATEHLENVFREVSGKKTICSIGSMNSSTDGVTLKQLSSGSDALQMHVLPNSEIDSSTEPKSCTINTTDDEYLTEKNDTLSHGIVQDATDSEMKHNHNCETIDEQSTNECDTFDDDVIQANIERKIQAYSISEADSDEVPANTIILTKDDFNVSTALGHLRSTTEETYSIKSAATKIQAGARGFLVRRRLGKSEADASASIGNAAIVTSLDNSVGRQELMQDQESFQVGNDVSKPVLTIDQTIEGINGDASVQGIIEVKMEQKKNDLSTSIVINENIMEKPTLAGTELKGTVSDDSGTAQRRLTLQRGDAMQRNSMPELKQKLLLIDKQKNDNDKPTNDEAPSSPKQDEAIQSSISASKLPTSKPMKTLGPRQRSMPVQFESMLMRVLPIPEQKRIKSAKNATPKKTSRRPNLF